MSKYPEEIVKVAEGLIEDHLKSGGYSQNLQYLKDFLGEDYKEDYLFHRCVQNAIVSCVFAKTYAYAGDNYVLGELEQIKSYLEELL